ncbi:NlpC/P60 family protein [Streptomyces sp. NPDC051207]|uniref:C40 family peptidase n=1 Tax=Streptomyces sp. NPDC051207 TaxID=3154641 RepID=UPI003423F137
MGTGKRGLITAAVAVVCAVTVLAAPGTAFAVSAAPEPSPTPSATPSAVPAKDLEAVRKRLERLYHDAAVATDAYNAAEEKAREQNAALVKLAQRIAGVRAELEELKKRAGAAAAAQYRVGGLPPEAHLMLSDDPTRFLDGTGRILQGQRATKGLIRETARTQEDLEQYERDATAQWKKLEANRKAKASARKRVEQQIAAAEKLESELEKDEIERLAELERAAARTAHDAWLDSGILDAIQGEASERGRKAVEFATAQIGLPYEWGAEGPESYDCSGLTSRAWEKAGVPVPRTSQEQWRQLRRIGIEDMRPGDLIIYHEDASHVGMYVGDGAIVHAPRPGRTVTVAGAGSMPILGVVRPDAD